MNTEEFTTVIEEQIERSLSILVDKNDGYSGGIDRLDHFKKAARLQGMSPRAALAGMMAKHSVSIYDMCHSDQTYSDEIINEKITDHINYLLLLRAVFEDEKPAYDPDFELEALRQKLVGATDTESYSIPKDNDEE